MKRVNPVYRIVAVRTAQASALGMLAHWVFHWPLMGPLALGLFLTPALCVYFVFVFVGPLTWGLPILTRLRGKQDLGGPDAVALTFDDGPAPETTPLLLDILSAQHVHATFFVLGESVAKHPGLLRRIVAEGHAVAIHGYRHQPLVLLNARAIRREVADTRAAIHAACPDAPILTWVRPPHGFKSPLLVWALCHAGYGLAAWSLDSRDYRESDPVRITARVLGRVKAGEIILLHDGPGNAATVAALPPLLRGLAERGLTCVCLPPS